MTEEVHPKSTSSTTIDIPEQYDSVPLRPQDIIVLRANRLLVGTVSQTYLDSDHDSIDDALIIAHSPIPPSAIHSFVTHGVPPKGFIFVEWAQPEYGHSLVTEQDVILIDRPFNIGDTVKTTADSMVGTVINVFESYNLEPIARITDGAVHFVQPNYKAPDAPRSSNGRVPSRSETSGLTRVDGWHDPSPALGAPDLSGGLLLNIPGEELKRAADFEGGDYVMRKDWVGIVEDSYQEVVLLLEDNALVIVKDSEELELVIPDFGKSLITIPDLNGIRRPEVFAEREGGMLSTPYHHLQRGQFVVTNHKNIREGRWLVGAYHESCKPQGYIMDIRAFRLEVQWLCPNPFALESPAAIHGPSVSVRPYENLTTFNVPSDLRRNKSLALYDRIRQPASSDDGPSVFPGHGTMRANRLMFKDSASAELKYKDRGGGHGQFVRIPKESAFGFDLNEFRVISCRQEVQIQWQDQKITRERSTKLIPYTLPEAELCPGDIVTLKHGTKQAAIGSPDSTAVEFNEMLYFQGNFRLWPDKIGVIQSVDSKERIARLRLFADHNVELLEQGNVLRAGSRLGNISEVVEEVSLYEVMSHPALLRRRGDLVILPPEHPHEDVILQLQRIAGFCLLGPSTLSYLRSVHPGSKFEHLRNIAKHYMQSNRSLPNSILPNVASQGSHDTSRPLDWIGEIMDIRTDGLATVRLGAMGSQCHDVNVPFERVLMVVDEDADLDNGSSQMSDVDPWTEYQSDTDEDDDYSVLLEEVEYEGGERLDDDSDSVWMTDEDEAEPQDVAMEDVAAVEPFDGVRDHSNNSLLLEAQTSSPTSHPLPPNAPRLGPSIKDLAVLRAETGNTGPPSFCILDSSPPPDQFGVSDTPTAFSADFLRRVIREHRILSTSLPANEVYVRTYESRLDLLRCLIIGPKDTPYEHAPFVIDLQLGPDFPQAPPIAHFHSWTGGLGRINPNMYEEGKICLSLLNTWPGQSEGESWTENASILQVLISLMGLVLVKQPFYNEAGFESYGEEKLYTRESQQYSEKAYVMARGFVKHAISNPVERLEDILAYLYLPPQAPEPSELSSATRSAFGGLLRVVIDRSVALIEGSAALRGSEEILVDGAGLPGDSTKTFLRPLSQGAVVMLRKTVSSLRELLDMVKELGEGS